MKSPKERPKVAFGINGLDELIEGGLPQGSSCLLRGGPGSGKTTIGSHFLAEGIIQGERVLFITLGEDRESLIHNTENIGIDLSQVDFLDLSPTSEQFEKSDSQTLFSVVDHERDQITKMIIDKMDEVCPRRVFIDSSSHLRLLSIDASQFRKQLLGLVRFLLSRKTTLLITSEYSPEHSDHQTQFLVDGVINLHTDEEWRYIEITKLRSSGFRAGRHCLRLGKEGCSVFPVLRAQEHAAKFDNGILMSDVPALDTMLHGGLERGTVTMITGPSGAGKTTLSLQFAQAAAKRHEKAVIFSFEETHATVVQRLLRLGYDFNSDYARNGIGIRSIEPLLVTVDEIAHAVRKEVEENKCRFFVLDSIAGFRLSIKSRQFLIDLRSLLKYLTNMGVTVIIINEVEVLTGEFRATEVGISFLSDNLIFLRYLELNGEMRKAIGVLKKRLSDFERYLREFSITKNGIQVGEPLVGLRGILSGTPDWNEKTAILPRSEP